MKFLNDFYNVVRSKELGSAVNFSSIRAKTLDSVLRSKELSSAVSFIFSFIFSYIFLFSNNISKFLVTYSRII